MVGPKSPPPGGIAAVVDTILGSELGVRFDFLHHSITEHQWQARGRGDALINAALCRTFGLDGFVSLATRAQLIAFRGALAQRPALVHIQASCGYDHWLGAWMARAAQRRGVPSLLHLHGVFDVRVPSWSRAKQAAFRATLRVPDRVIVLSDGWRRWFATRMDPGRLVVLRNAVDVRRFPVRAVPRTDGVLRVLFVGAYDPAQKGAYDILAAAPEIVREAPQVRFVFVGRDVDELERRFVAGTPMAGHFEFLGSQDPAEMPDLFARADLLVLPSYGEGLPITLLEAMAAALPVVVSPVNAIPEVVSDPENGLFVPPGDRAALTRAIVALARDPERRRRMGAANRSKAEQELDVSRLAHTLGALYDELLQLTR